MENHVGAVLVAMILSATAGCSSHGTTTRDAVPNDSSVTDSNNDPVIAGPREWQSGTRLRAQVFDGASGATLFRTWFDTERNVACSWMQTADGTVRCLPRQSYRDSFFYADSGCTQRVAIESDCEPLSPYVTYYERNQTNPAVYELTALPATPTALFAGQPGACAPQQFDSTPGIQVTYAAPVALEQFVAATISREPRGAQRAAILLGGRRAI